MIGNNEFHFNEATMIQALDEYLRARMPNEVMTVTQVKYDGGQRVFIVSVDSAAKERTP